MKPNPTQETTAAKPKSMTSRPQFNLTSMFWLLLSGGMYLAYLRQFSDRISIMGCLVILLGLATGAVVGLFRRQFVAPMYWATLVSAFAMVSVAEARGLSLEFRLSWCMVGATSGAVCALPVGRHLILRTVLGTVAAGLTMGVFLLFFRERSADSFFDGLGAPFIGACVGILISLIQGLELHRQLPHYLIATWLLLAVLVGNFLTTAWLY